MLFLERALTSAKMGHFFMDPRARTIAFSPWVCRNIGLPEKPISLDDLPKIIVEEERDAFRQTVEEIIEHQEDFAFETRVVTAKGVTRAQLINGIAAFADEEKQTELIGYFGLLQEVTSQKEAERELLEARDNAQAELAARTNILATVSHEIRTPLGGILGIIDQLKRERSSIERERALSLIEDSCEVLLDTLDAILQQARLGESDEGLSQKLFRPRALADRVAELFRPLARRKALMIEVKAKSDREAAAMQHAFNRSWRTLYRIR